MAFDVGPTLPNYHFKVSARPWQNDPFVRTDHGASPGLDYWIETENVFQRRAKPTVLLLRAWHGRESMGFEAGVSSLPGATPRVLWPMAWPLPNE